MKIQYTLRGSDHTLEIDQIGDDITLNKNNIVGLFKIAKEPHDVFNYPSLLQHFRASREDKLCELGLINGTISKGQTTWTLTDLGKEVLIALNLALAIEVKKLEKEIVDLADQNFEHRLGLGYYRKLPDGDEQFYVDILEEYGLRDGPKVKKAYDIAYAEGHANGFHEVSLYFDELVNLLRIPDDLDMFNPNVIHSGNSESVARGTSKRWRGNRE